MYVMWLKNNVGNSNLVVESQICKWCSWQIKLQIIVSMQMQGTYNEIKLLVLNVYVM